MSLNDECHAQTLCGILHNTPMQYTAIFQGCKNDSFQMKNCDIFFIFAQNIDCVYVSLGEASSLFCIPAVGQC